MKKLASLMLFAFLILLQPAHATITSWDIDISLNGDGTSNWIVMQKFNETVQKTDYFVLAQITDLDVIVENSMPTCNVRGDVGVSIFCENVNSTAITYKFTTKEITSLFVDLTIFRYKFAVTQAADRFSVVVRLPLGTAIVEKDKIPSHLQPFEPSFGREGSDGRRIFIEWVLNRPKLGETIDVSIIFERLSEERQFTLFAVIVAGIVIAAVAFLVYFFKRKPVMDILPVLTENERAVMQIVLAEKEVDQRKIVRDTDYSKAKVTRLIQDLEKRGLIEKQRKGRKNIVRLRSR